jgi:hypothetical protein
MKKILSSFVSIIILITAGCAEKFTPDIDDVQYIPVVEGLITNQPEVYTIRLYWSIPVGETKIIPLGRCDVKVHDDHGHIYKFTETSTPGTYVSDSTTFQGVVGRKYTLRINTNNATPKEYSYESVPVEMKAVPPIDSLYYEKALITGTLPWGSQKEGIQIYLNTYDPTGECRFFRWNYTETWKFEIPYIVPNQTCWITINSKDIDIKNTMTLSDSRIVCHPVILITNETDRLSRRYSIIVNQYSLSEEEFAYWEKLQNVTQDVGSLYDIIPFSIPGNIYCVEDPGEKILGYFSVSARTSKRIYINTIFPLSLYFYRQCAMDPVMMLYNPRCLDCTYRGTLKKPDFWVDY